MRIEFGNRPWFLELYNIMVSLGKRNILVHWDFK